MRIAFFITPHGFGHAARASAIMDALYRRQEDCRFDIYTRIPQWFFKDSLPPCFQYHDLLSDVGLVQTSPLEVDLNATLETLDAFLPFKTETVDALAESVARADCKAVVCDISPLGIAVAKTAGIPSILVENFTWDWIYEAYVDSHPRFQKAIDYLGQQFQVASVHIQTDPICNTRPWAARLFPISRPARLPADEVKTLLQIPKTAPAVLVTMGGVATRHRFTAQLKSRKDVYFILPQEISYPRHEGNLVHLPQRSGFFHPDLVRAADAVVGKAGYSTLAEVCHAGKPFGYVPAGGNRESSTLAAYADAFAPGMAISASAFESAGWLSDLDRLLQMPKMQPLPNAANIAAAIILETVETGVKPEVWAGREEAPLRFDPFSVRKARTLRNQLSQAFVEALNQNESSHVEQVISALSQNTREFVYRQYISDRKERYQRVFEQIRKHPRAEPLARMLFIWNARLFFECHEYLEPMWLEAQGNRREAIKGLIQAAGAFVHLERGQREPATRMAAKAVELIGKHRNQLAFIKNINEFLATLTRTEGRVPRL
jgi:UDP:flavonoid glycosyltransferase YjiC (YdhE family)